MHDNTRGKARKELYSAHFMTQNLIRAKTYGLCMDKLAGGLTRECREKKTFSQRGSGWEEEKSAVGE